MTPKISTMDQLKNVSAELDAWEQGIKHDTYLLLKEFKDMVIVTDNIGIIKFANASSFRVLGYEPDALIGQSVDMLSEENLHHEKKISDYLLSKSSKLLGVGRSVVAKNKLGFNVNAYLYVSELKGEGEPLFVGVLHKV